MDDLALFLHRVQSINSLTLIFQKYEQRTEAKLNYNKCFVLSIEKTLELKCLWLIIWEKRLYTWEL